MGKTIRKVNHSTSRYADHLMQHENPVKRRQGQAFKKGAKSFRTGKAGCANIDSEGNFKLNAWEHVASKNKTTVATRKLRRANKLLTQRQLEDADGEPEYDFNFD